MRLFAMPGTCALAPNIVALWGGVDVTVVNLARGEHREPAYLAINPKGQVPALEIAPGNILTEASAITRYIAALSPHADINPQDPERWARIDEALSYFTSEVHADFGGHFSSRRFAESESAQAEVKAATYQKIAEHFARIDASVMNHSGNYYLGTRSIADAYLFVITRWIDGTPLSISDYPNVQAFRERISVDASVKQATERQGMAG
jgi:glutathione S-transferase